jgi:hypothetical protein
MKTRTIGLALAALLGLFAAPLFAAPQSQPSTALTVTYFYLPG